MMRVRLSLPLLAGVLALLSGCGGPAPVAGAGRDGVLRFDGQVVHVELEGGFWGLVAADGSRYDPGGLPQRLQQPGLRVRVQARPVAAASIRMWGTPVRIVAIEAIP